VTSHTEKIFNQLQKQLRDKAESLLASEGEAKPSAGSADKILHELHVHQIELEMQNEELRGAQNELEIARDRYIDLYDFAPVGYLTVDEKGLIVECNLTAANLLGHERRKLINRRFAGFIAAEDKDIWYLHCQKHKEHHAKQSCELTLCRPGEDNLSVLLESLCIKPENATSAWRISLTDITARKKAEQASRIAAVAFETHEGLLVTDTELKVLCVNKAFTGITGFDQEEIIGRIPFFLQARLDNKSFSDIFWKSIADNGYWQGELWDRRKNGEDFALLLSITEVSEEKGCVTHYVACCSEITQLKLAETLLKNHYSRLQVEMQTAMSELEHSKLEAADVTTALNVLLKQRNSDLAETKASLSYEAERTVLPFLTMLKKGARDRNELRLIDIVETNLKHLLESYGNSGSLTSAYQKLTPVEIQVATLVRQGLPTKVIADSLNLSPGTVSIHRKHIRKKLGLDQKSHNLYSYLVSLAEQNSH
jgi:PAS domain S-box-containing protein